VRENASAATIAVAAATPTPTPSRKGDFMGTISLKLYEHMRKYKPQKS
jgi:hypothetical protein